MTCPYCGVIFKKYKTKEKIFKNGTKHVQAFCPDCGKHIKYLPQYNDFDFWFGKYKGKKLSEIMKEDREYLEWLIKNLDKKLSNKIRKTLKKLQ